MKSEYTSQLGACLVLCLSLLYLPSAISQPAPLPESIELSKWAQPLPKPPVARPYCTRHGEDRYKITMDVLQHSFHPDLNLTTVYGYDGVYPGPTIEAVVDRPVAVQWINRLPKQHILPTENLVHGGMEPVPEDAAVVHLHGAHVPGESDGFPMDWVLQGEALDYWYPNNQLALTMFYHDHIMSRTRVNVYAGLTGFYLLRDQHEHKIGLPSGRFEMPMLIQDRRINESSFLWYPFLWGAFEGDIPVVNGKAYPYYEVKPRAYRFRLLNACNHRFLTLSLPGGPAFWQIASDGGFLEEPVRRTSITLGPAERADVIVDFYGFEGKYITLTNSAPAPFPGGEVEERMKEILQFRVDDHKCRRCRPYKMPCLRRIAKVPPLPNLETLPEHSIAMERFLPLEQGLVFDPVTNTSAFMFRLAGKGFHDPPTETPLVNTVELWHIINLTPLTHPIHIHLTQFRLLQRRSFAGPFVEGTPINFTGPPRIPGPEEQGWKDTVRVDPGDVATLWVPFTDHTGTYVWHCHMLEHEDHDMMRPLVVRPRCSCCGDGECHCGGGSEGPNPPHEH